MNGVRGVVATGTYTTFRDQFSFRSADGADSFTTQWTLDGTSLVFSEFDGACYMSATWAIDPWERVA